MIASSSIASLDDFYFVGETQSLTDGTKVKSFGNTFGFVMKLKINSPDESCFNLPNGYSIDMNVASGIPFVTASFLNYDSTNNWLSANVWWNNFQSGLSITLESSLFN
jgi:hypothetical protein